MKKLTFYIFGIGAGVLLLHLDNDIIKNLIYLFSSCMYRLLFIPTFCDCACIRSIPCRLSRCYAVHFWRFIIVRLVFLCQIACKPQAIKKGAIMVDYSEKALQFAESHGIVNYIVKNGKMIFFKRCAVDCFGNFAYYKNVVDLDTLQSVVKVQKSTKYKNLIN